MAAIGEVHIGVLIMAGTTLGMIHGTVRIIQVGMVHTTQVGMVAGTILGTMATMDGRHLIGAGADGIVQVYAM